MKEQKKKGLSRLFEIAGENASNEWLEPVTDEEYDKLK